MPVVSCVVSVVVAAVSVVSYNVSQVFSVHYEVNKQNQVSILCFVGVHSNHIYLVPECSHITKFSPSFFT